MKIAVQLGNNDDLIVHVPTGVTSDAHPDGTYKLSVPADERGYACLIRVLRAQRDVTSPAQRRIGASDAAPTVSDIEAWLREGGKIKRPEPPKAPPPDSLEDLGL